MTIEAANKLDPISIDGLLARQDPFGESPATFDLTGIQLVTPGAAVMLAAACHSVAKQGYRSSVNVPDLNVRSYLLRAGFDGVVESVADIQPSIGTAWHSRQGSNPMLIELTQLSSERDLPELLDRTIWALRHRLKFRKREAFDVATAISEICQNTFDHNIGAVGFFAMQGYKGRFLEIGVSDCGVGITETLRRNPNCPQFSSDLAAIQHATELGTSEHDDPTRGTGLHHLLEITYRHEGSVQIRSGSSKVRYRMDRKQGWGFEVYGMPGVHIALTLNSKRRA